MRTAILTRASLATICIACLGSIATADYKAAVEALNPSHYWQLEETVEGTAIDSAGNKDGTHGGSFAEDEGVLGVPGPPVPGLSENNLAFGANDWASIDIGPGIDMANSVMTVSAWFTENGSEGGDRLWTNNQTDGNVSFQIFFGGGSGDVAANIGIGLNPSVNGFPASGLPSGSGVGNFHIPETTVAVKDGEWHHIVASRNGNNIEDVIVVIDGVNYGPDTWRDSTDTWGTTTTNAQIATRTPGNGGGSQHVLNGSIDEVAVWLGRQLTVEEAIGLYNAAVNPTTGLPGDFDGSGAVGNSDLTLLLDNWGATVPPDPTGWTNDLPTAPAVGNDDLTRLLDNWGNSALSTSNVPEPNTLILLTISCCGLVLSRRR